MKDQSYSSSTSLTLALDGIGGNEGHSAATLPPGITQYPTCRRLGVSQGRYGRVRKISLKHGFDPRTNQPVASRHIYIYIYIHI